MISETSVTAALEGLLHNIPKGSLKSLENLALVDEALCHNPFPQSELIRQYVLWQILSDIITQELSIHRAAVGIFYDNLEASQAEALRRIGHAATYTNLRGWSHLYYRYIRVDLEISVDLLSRSAQISTRTATRDKERAIRQLVFRLITLEKGARAKHGKHHLRAQLPMLTAEINYGREAELQRVASVVEQATIPHFQIVGEYGIGKTAFVYAAVRDLIERERIDDLVWLERPCSVSDLWGQLTSLVYEAGLNLSIREFLQYRRFAFVFDETHQLWDSNQDFQVLLRDLEAAIVYVINTEPIPVENVMHYIVLSSLEKADAEDMIRARLSQWDLPNKCDLREEVDAIQAQSTGNPELVERAVWQLCVG